MKGVELNEKTGIALCSHLPVTLHEAGCPQTASPQVSPILQATVSKVIPSGFLTPMDLELSSKALFLHD